MAAEGQSDKLVSDTELHIGQRCGTEFLHAEKIAPSDIVNTCWMFMETKQWMWAQWGCEWCISPVVTLIWRTIHIPDSHAGFYESGIQALLHCWQKWRANGGNDVEKQCFIAKSYFFICYLYIYIFLYHIFICFIYIYNVYIYIRYNVYIYVIYIFFISYFYMFLYVLYTKSYCALCICYSFHGNK